MAQKYPSTKRPRRKLFGNMENCPAKPWARKLTLEDVDGMFDDVDSAEFPSLVLDSSNESKITPKGPRPPSVKKMKEHTAFPCLPSAEQNIDSEVPFKEHGPVQTSSPIESSMAVGKAEQNSSFSPILLHVDDEDDDEEEEELHVVKKVRSEPVANQVLQLNGSLSEKAEAPPAQQGTSKNQQKSISTNTISGPSLEESKSLSMEKTPVKASHQGRETTPFLQKLKEVGQAKSARSRKLLTPVKAPPQPTPELDDDFLILDVDDPLWITIPKKNALNQNKSKASNHDCTGERRSPQQTVPKEEASKAPVRSQKKKGKLSKKPSAPTENVDDVPLNDDKPTKKQKQPLMKRSSKETETPVEGPEIAVGGKRGKVQSPESNKLAKVRVTQTKQSLKKTQKEKHTSEGEKNVSDDAVESICDPQNDTHHEDQGSVSEKELMESPTNKGGRSTKSSSAPDVNHIKSCQILGKRKRYPTKEFWLISPQDGTQPESSDESPGAMSKQNTVKPSLPVKKPQVALKKGRNGTVSVDQSCDEKGNKRSKKSLIQDHGREQENPVPPSPTQQSDHSTRLGDQQANSHRLASPSREKRRRKPPGEWWKVDSLEEAEASPPDRPYATTIKPLNEREAHPKQIGGSGHPTVKSSRKASRPVGGAPESRLSQSRKSSLKSIPKSTTRNPSGARQRQHQDEDELPASDPEVPLMQKNGRSACKVIMQDESSGDEGQHYCPSNSTFNVCVSGPPSRIDLDMYRESNLSSSQTPPAVLSVSDLCAPPLKPMVLQPVDRTNLTRWLMRLWSSPADDSESVESVLEQFQWFFFQHRALGIMEDCNSGTVSSGMVILGSYMKKPLWVDHSATTVFHLLTSTLKVTVDLAESCYKPGHSFIVPCGHAYSIQNLTSLPAALYFTRMQTESPG